MRSLVSPLRHSRLLVGPALAAALLLVAIPAACAAPLPYPAFLDGVSESPPSASPGTGLAEAECDAATHTLHLHVDFSGLLAPATASHIHGPTAVALTGTTGVMTTTPSSPGSRSG